MRPTFEAILAILSLSLLHVANAASHTPRGCRAMPGDVEWPSTAAWKLLNLTVGGRLIAGVPLGRPCFNPGANLTKCEIIKSQYTQLDPYINDPVNIMSPYWQNNSCSPFLGNAPNGPCSLGNIANYAINVTSPADAIAGILFASIKNTRLTIKNTGHDFLGRSSGAGSLALWTHNLKEITFLNYTSRDYSGPAVRLGAGIQGSDLLTAAKKAGYRVLTGSCPSVGISGGFTQGGGHSPLSSKYGLSADQVLEFDVLTGLGIRTTASPSKNPNLFWALSGGGAGTFAVVLSMIVKVYTEGSCAGANFLIFNDGDDNGMKFWKAIAAWLRHLLVLDTIPGYMTTFVIGRDFFALGYALVPDALSVEDITDPLKPFLEELVRLGVSVVQSSASLLPSYADWYATYAAPAIYTTNNAIGGRLIPRSIIQNNTTLTNLVNVFREIVEVRNAPPIPNITPLSIINGISLNLTSKRLGNTGLNAVLPAWRDALFTMNFGIPIAEDALWETLKSSQAWINKKQNRLRSVTPGGGTYMNEATFDNPYWKQDYFGENYDRLLAVKKTYDPFGLFWGNAAVGSDLWKPRGDGRLCKV